ncbi:MAG TPA: M56 family metallopeptidase [Tepidisphaeraceae bacterium]|jgi:beta-lactamase regulating signal transducer with metallopeptidase domain
MTPETLDRLLGVLWQMTWQAGLLAGAIALVVRIVRFRLSPQAMQLLWMLVFVRLATPVLPASALSIFGLLKQESPAPAVQITISNDAPVIPFTSAPAVVAEAPRSSQAWKWALLLLWIGGAATVMGSVVLSTARFTARMNRTAGIPDQWVLALVGECARVRRTAAPAVLLSEEISTPALMGVLHPRLLLPPAVLSNLDAGGLRAVIMHELEHLRRRHLLMDWILTFIRAIHWFNPAAWLVNRQIRAARELICDRSVIAAESESDSRCYGEAMLTLAAAGMTDAHLPSTMAAFAREQGLLRQRIEAIAAGKRKYIAGLGLLLVAAIAVVFLTRPRVPQPSAPQPIVAQLLTEAKGLVDAGLYDQALPVVDHILELEPGNEFAIGIRPFLAEPALAPPTKSLPTNRSEADTAALALLDRKLPEVKFEQVGFADVVQFLRDTTSANIFVHWKAVEEAGIQRNTPITARLRDVKLSKALETLLRDIGGTKSKLGYAVDEGVITITTQDELNSNVATRVYDIRDLLQTAGPDPRSDQARQALVDSIIKLIEETLDWNSHCKIRELSGQLIVTATPDLQRQLIRLLAQLRQTRGVQIMVETRFLSGTPPSDALPNGDVASVSLVTDDRVNSLLKLAETKTLNAPRLVVFNGETAVVRIGTDTVYITNFSALPDGNGGTSYQPKTRTFEDGIKLDCTATMAGDGKSISLRLRPTVAHLIKMESKPWPGAPAGKDLFIQTPIAAVASADKSIAAPDGTWVMLGMKSDQGEQFILLTRATKLPRPSTFPIVQP